MYKRKTNIPMIVVAFTSFAVFILLLLYYNNIVVDTLFTTRKTTTPPHETSSLSEVHISFNTKDIDLKIASYNASLQEHDLIYNPQPRRNTVPIVNEEFNVIFFQVAKVASTEWKRFFSRLKGSTEWCAEQTLIHKRKVNQLSFLSDYSLDEAERMMKDPRWKKVVFVRHPKPRLLSAFLDKAVVNSDIFVSRYCQAYANQDQALGLGGNLLDYCIHNHQSFDFFLNNFTRMPFLRENVHWRTIYSRIDAKWWPYIDFVGKMENINDDAKEFLNSIHSNIDGDSAWERIGQSGWGDKTTENCTIAGMSEGQFLGVRDANHTTRAKAKMMEYYTPELERMVEERYAEDIDNPYFKFEPFKLFS